MLGVDNIDNWDEYGQKTKISHRDNGINRTEVCHSIADTQLDKNTSGGENIALDVNYGTIANDKMVSQRQFNTTASNNITDVFGSGPTTNSNLPKGKSLSKDMIIGNLMKNARKSGNSLLFAIISNIKSYDIAGNEFRIVCDQISNYEDILSKNINDFIVTTLKEIDCNLVLSVQLLEDKSDEIREANVRKLRAELGDLVKIVE